MVVADTVLQKAFGAVVRELRTQAGLSQEELAFAADRHFTYVSLLERGRNSPSITTVWRLAEALGVTAPELITQVDAHVRRTET